MKSIFIVGTQRSGTTLLRLILNAHSRIAIPEEAEFLKPLLKKKYLKEGISGRDYINFISYLKKNPQFKLWNYNSGALFEQLANKKNSSVKEIFTLLFSSYAYEEGQKNIWGDKTPVFLRKIDLLRNIFPETIFIHIVRDGRDVFDSWRKMDHSKDNAAVTALDWCYKIFRIRKSFKKIPDSNRITIRYEDLIECPESTVQKICEKIGITFERRMLKFYLKSNEYIGDHHSALIFNPLNSRNKEKWRKNLSDEELKIYNLVSGYYLRKYGYKLDTPSASIDDFLSMFKSLLNGLPQRVRQVVSARRSLEKAFGKGETLPSGVAGKMPQNKKLVVKNDNKK